MDDLALARYQSFRGVTIILTFRVTSSLGYERGWSSLSVSFMGLSLPASFGPISDAIQSFVTASPGDSPVPDAGGLGLATWLIKFVIRTRGTKLKLESLLASL